MKTPIKHLRLGTRGSPLALTQTEMVKAALAAHYSDIQSEVVVLKTSGDWKHSDGEVRLSEANGGKGQFAKELEEALLRGEIDLAVHSMKDMDSNLPDGLSIECMLPRQDPRDAIICRENFKNSANFSQLKMAKTGPNLETILEALGPDVRVGTSSVRRAAFLKSIKPDIRIETLRGNVQTRIDKLNAGQVDITLLAMAGLNRLGLGAQADFFISETDMLPSAGQGAVGVEIRRKDVEVAKLLDAISCSKTVCCVKSEREALRVLDGSCDTPIGAHAVLEGENMHLKVAVVSLDGSQLFEDEIRAIVRTSQEAIALGNEIGQRLKSKIPAEIFRQKLAAL
jgi:hydroxymethylbilane synthase